MVELVPGLLPVDRVDSTKQDKSVGDIKLDLSPQISQLLSTPSLSGLRNALVVDDLRRTPAHGMR